MEINIMIDDLEKSLTRFNDSKECAINQLTKEINQKINELLQHKLYWGSFPTTTKKGEIYIHYKNKTCFTVTIKPY